MSFATQNGSEAADLLASRRLAWAQQNHPRTGVGGVIDVDWEKTLIWRVADTVSVKASCS
jgi:hypothetical protein